MKNITRILRGTLSLLLVVLCSASVCAGVLPTLTTQADDPYLYRIRNTRRTAKAGANYWTMPNGLSENQADAQEVYFTGVRTTSYLRVQIHQKETGLALAADFTWSQEGIEWYIKEFTSAQGGGYTGVLISNSPDFPDVYNDKVADDGLGCWYVGTKNTAPWLYGGQWDGSIFTLEAVDPDKVPSYLVEIPQTQSPEIEDGASRATVEEHEGYTSYTTDGGVCVIVKMYNVDVKDCDYILFKFAEPTPSDIKYAFWKQGGTDNESLPADVTEFKYVFADDPKCAIQNDLLPQITLLTLWSGGKTVKIEGIYKHSSVDPGEDPEPDPLADALEVLRRLIPQVKPFQVGTELGLYSGEDPAPLIAKAEACLTADDNTLEQVQEYIDRLKAIRSSLVLNLPDVGAEFRLYNPALKAYVSARKGDTRMKMVAEADENTVFVYDGKNLVGKASGLYTSTYNLTETEETDQVTFVEAYGNHPGLYTVEYTGGSKERCLMAEEAGKECNRHFLSNQSGYSTGTQNATAFQLVQLSDKVILPVRMTADYVSNASFESGDLTGWVYSSVLGDVGVKPNSDGTYTCQGADGDYLFNTWISSDERVGATQDHCVYQTVYGLPQGEYRLEALAASNQQTGVTLFANHFTQNFVPREKSAFSEHRLTHVYVTPDTRSLVLGMRSASWFKADDFRLTYLGKTDAYAAYLAKGNADASIMRPVLLDCFDGQRTDGFTYQSELAEGYGTFGSTAGGVQKDGTSVDRSLLQVWTDSTHVLSPALVSTTYENLPAGYYKVSAAVRVYDENGTVNKPARGLTFFAGDAEAAVARGTMPDGGGKKAKAFWGEYAVITQVLDGKLTAGLKIGEASFNWVGWQNFRLEYLGTDDPADELVNLNLPEGKFVPLCLPYDITPDYFGPLYAVVGVEEGKAMLLPCGVETVPSGTPCVVKATGKNPEVTIHALKLNFGVPRSVLTWWDNTLLVGSYEGYTWNADLVDRTLVKGADLDFQELDINHLNFTATTMNRAAQRFWNENADYTTSSSSTIEKYLNEVTINRADQPNPVLVPVPVSKKKQYVRYSTDPDLATGLHTVGVEAGESQTLLYNLLPGFTYYYKVQNTDIRGQFKVEGDLRMIYVGHNVYNVRDLGGKKTADGRYVRYGRIFRSGELNGGYKATTEELKTLKNVGVGAEIDLRGELDNSGAGTSAYGFRKGVNYYYVGGDHYVADDCNKLLNDDAESKMHWKNELEFVVQNLAAGRGINFHCRIGADRTGVLAMLLEGLLGVTEEDMLRDYETTSFSTAAGTRIKHQTFDGGINYFKNHIPAGGTLRDAFDAYCQDVLGVDKAVLQQYRSLMLLDEPEAVGIASPVVVPAAAADVYDLQGRCISHPRKGLYVREGRKVLVR